MSSIRGLQKTTLIDYPGKIACIIFLSGCNFRCPFCHNKDLVLESKNLPHFSEERILKFLKSRVGILEGVEFTGGEPTLYPHLEEFMRRIKELGFLVKLDTNGTNPKVLKRLVKNGLVDYVAMDFKAPVEKYEKAVGVKVDKEAILKSMRFLAGGEVDYEFRTTVVPKIHKKEDLIKMAEQLKKLTLSHQEPKWFLQQFRPGSCLDPKFNKIKPYPKKFFEQILPKLREIVPHTFLRGF